MNKSIILSAVALLFLVPSLQAVALSAEDRPLDCDATIIDVLRGISDRGAIIEYSQKKDASSAPGNPFRSSESFTIVLNGSGNGSLNPKKSQQIAHNVLNSGRLNYAWAKQIMAACPHIAIVSFGMWRTGWLSSFYRFSDGQVRPRVCTRSIESPEYWGLGWCD